MGQLHLGVIIQLKKRIST